MEFYFSVTHTTKAGNVDCFDSARVEDETFQGFLNISKDSANWDEMKKIIYFKMMQFNLINEVRPLKFTNSVKTKKIQSHKKILSQRNISVLTRFRANVSVYFESFSTNLRVNFSDSCETCIRKNIHIVKRRMWTAVLYFVHANYATISILTIHVFHVLLANL